MKPGNDGGQKNAATCVWTGVKSGAVLPNQADVSPKCAAVIFFTAGASCSQKTDGGKTVKSGMEAAAVPLG